MAGYMPFTPIAALLLGAILNLLPPRVRAIGPRERGILAFLTAGASFILSLSLLGEAPLSFTISHWRPLAQFGGELAYRLDDLALAFVLLLTFTSAAAILASLNSFIHEEPAYLLTKPLPGKYERMYNWGECNTPNENSLRLLVKRCILAVCACSYIFRREFSLPTVNGERFRYAAILTLLAAGISFFLSANLLTLYVSWGFLDLSMLFLFGAHDGKEETAKDLTKALAASHLAGLALLMAALRLGQDVGQMASLPTSVAFPFLLAALLRLGLYPLHLWLPTNMEGSSPAVALLHILPTSAGIYLLMRLSALSPQGLPQKDMLLFMGGSALVASALLLWRGEGSRGWYSYLLVNQVAYAVLAMALDASPRGIMAALLQTLNLVLACSILFLRGKSDWVGERVILGVAVASLLGLPLTLGFPARWLVYGLAFEGEHGALIVAGAAANLITVAPLLDFLLNQGEGRRDRVGLIGLGLLIVPLLLFGFLPSVLPIKLLGGEAWLTPVGGGRAARSLALLLLPPLGGYLLHRRGWVLDRIGSLMKGLAKQMMRMPTIRYSETVHHLLNKLCAVISLEWLYRSLWWLSLKVGKVLQVAMGAIEGERCLGWLLLSAFVVTLLLLGD